MTTLATTRSEQAATPPRGWDAQRRMRPTHRASDRAVTGTPRFADARRGSDAGDGSERLPWRTIAHALTQLRAGDTLLLLGGTFYENVYIARTGRADAPITIRSHPGEVAIIDGGGAPEFIQSPATAWELVTSPSGASGVSGGGGVPDLFRSTKTYLNRRYAFAWFGESMVGLLNYFHREDLEELHRTLFEKHEGEPFPAPVYLGPGVWYDDQTGHIYCRLSHTAYRFQTPGTANYTGHRDPHDIPMVVSFYGSLPLYLDGAQHVVLQDLVVRGAGEDAVRLRGCRNLTLDNVTIYCGTYGLHSRSSGPVKILNCGFYGSLPPWQVHAGQALRVSDPDLRMPNGKPPTRDVARLNTHVILAIEGRTEEQVDYYVPGNRQWELAYSDFTDSADGIHLGGFGVRFHHNRIDRLMDDAVYLTPLTPRSMGDVQVYNNLFTRCLFSLGFGGFSEPALGPVYIYRNIFDQRCDHLWAHYGPARSPVICTHFSGRPKLGELYLYHNTVITQMNPRLSHASSSDVDRTYAQSFLVWTEEGLPRRVFNNLFVYPLGMIPPSEDSLPPVNEDVQIDGNVHFDLVRPERSAEKLAEFHASERFAASKARYAFGWEAHACVGDPRFVAFEADAWACNDYRIMRNGVASSAGVVLPENWPDSVEAPRKTKPDCGALPVGAEPSRAGRVMDDETRRRFYAWLERPVKGEVR